MTFPPPQYEGGLSQPDLYRQFSNFSFQQGPDPNSTVQAASPFSATQNHHPTSYYPQYAASHQPNANFHLQCPVQPPTYPPTIPAQPPTTYSPELHSLVSHLSLTSPSTTPPSHRRSRHRHHQRPRPPLTRPNSLPHDAGTSNTGNTSNTMLGQPQPLAHSFNANGTTYHGASSYSPSSAAAAYQSQLQQHNAAQHLSRARTSSSVRAARQAHVRLQSTAGFARDVAAVVERMGLEGSGGDDGLGVDGGDDGDGDDDDDDEGVAMDPADLMALPFRRSNELSGQAGWVAKRVKVRKCRRVKSGLGGAGA